MKLGIIGLGFVGSAIYDFFKNYDITIKIYDKYKNEYNNFINIIDTDLCYISVPTSYDEEQLSYDYSAIFDVYSLLIEHNYKGLIILKSTIEPNFINNILFTKYPVLKDYKIIYNPEFLSSKTASYDFANQKHIIIGIDNNDYFDTIYNFYKLYFPNSDISISSIIDAESTKIFCNCFYAIKIQIFNEFYNACKINGANFNNIRDMMLKNNWINPMHTKVPGEDNKLSFGGGCFPKDIKALNSYFKKINSYNGVIEATIKESQIMREN